MRPLSLLLLAALAACGGQDPAQSSRASLAAAAAKATDSAADRAADAEATALCQDHGNPNPSLYERHDRPFGRSVERWSELLWSYIYAQPFDTNPFLDPTGAHCGLGQEGPVWFLPSVPGSNLGNVVTRSCTIPRHKAVILQLASALNDFPCPDPDLQAGARAVAL